MNVSERGDTKLLHKDAARVLLRDTAIERALAARLRCSLPLTSQFEARIVPQLQAKEPHYNNRILHTMYGLDHHFPSELEAANNFEKQLEEETSFTYRADASLGQHVVFTEVTSDRMIALRLGACCVFVARCVTCNLVCSSSVVKWFNSGGGSSSSTKGIE